MFWKKLADIILKSRLLILFNVLLFCGFMGFKASKVHLAYNAGKILPVTDSAYIRFIQFRKMFGEDGTAIVLGIKTPNLFQKDLFNAWYQLGNRLQKIQGVTAVVSQANIYKLHKDTLQRRFFLSPLINQPVATQHTADSIKQQVYGLPFYSGLILSADKQATSMVVSLNPQYINSKLRTQVIGSVLKEAKQFEDNNHVAVHISGQPYIRTVISDLVSHEFVQFLGLSLLITAIILIIFYRTAYAVIFPLIVVLLGVICSLGIMVLNNYDITLLTGIIPPLVVIIGIPNSIFILNKYYREFGLSGDKMAALHIVIEKVGITTFIANVTTAIGFGVLYFTNSQILTEFGLVASISIMVTFALTLIPCGTPLPQGHLHRHHRFATHQRVRHYTHQREQLYC